jgi:hypothetical protein
MPLQNAEFIPYGDTEDFTGRLTKLGDEHFERSDTSKTKARRFRQELLYKYPARMPGTVTGYP